MNQFTPRAVLEAEATVRLTAPASYCSGVLIAEDLEPHRSQETSIVLTCAHFFRDLSPQNFPIRVSGAGFRRQISAVRKIDGSDIAVAKLASAAPARTLPGVTRRRIMWWQHTQTYGYGAKHRTRQLKPGLMLATLPVSLSRNLSTLVAPAGLVLNRPRAVKGDSGGPVLGAGELLATQSLILDPFGLRTPIATVSLLGPHRRAIARAVAALSGASA